MAATYTVKQVAELLGYSTNSIYTFLKEGRIKGIRVGTGRFRIPQSELDRLLVTVKKQPIQTATPTPTVVPLGPVSTTDVPGSAIIEHTQLFGFVHLGTLNVFDWFIGTGAVVAGLGLFLFNNSLSFIPSQLDSPIVAAMRALFIGVGIAILVTNITGQTHTFWHKLFHILLGMAGFVLAVTFWRMGDIDGSLTYGPLALLVILATFIHIGGVAWASLYVTLLTIGTNIVVIMVSANPRFSAFLSRLPFSWETSVTIVTVSSVLFLVALWLGYFKNKQLFWFATWFAAFWYFAVAFWYASDVYWSRSFFFLVVGMTCLYLSPWESLAAIKSRRADLFTIGVFTGIFGILIAGIAAVFLMQTNSIQTVERENKYKVAFAKQDLEDTLRSVSATIDAASINSDFAAAVEKKDIAYLNASERIMYDSNHMIRRFVILDADGQGVNLYPFGTFDEADLSDRDYYINVRDTGTDYLTNAFEARTDQSHRQVVALAAPIFGKNHVFVGVLVASLDLEAISARQQKVAVPDRNEYIVIVDANGKRIVHNNFSLLGTKTEADDPILLALQGKTGVGTGMTYDGKRAVVAYEPLTTHGVHWGVAIKTPITQVYELTDISNLSLFSMIVAALILAGCILQGGFFWQQRKYSPGAGP